MCVKCMPQIIFKETTSDHPLTCSHCGKLNALSTLLMSLQLFSVFCLFFF